MFSTSVRVARYPAKSALDSLFLGLTGPQLARRERHNLPGHSRDDVLVQLVGVGCDVGVKQVAVTVPNTTV